ncbi:MAG: Nramp family divalent metal transporter [Micrococcaceae bacterium]
MVEAKPEQRKNSLWRLLGPGFVAAIAYVDPGNVAANLTAGAQFGYLLVWVLLVANAMAIIVQYLSAKLGIVTGKSLPQLISSRLSRRARLAYWMQAEAIAFATDIAEIIGGAIAFKLLFNMPLVFGGIVTGILSLLLLIIRERRGQRAFEQTIMVFLFVLTVGFCAGLVLTPPNFAATMQGLVPRFDGASSVLVSVSMLGATVMPHAVYLHSALTRDRFTITTQSKKSLLRATRYDVFFALIIAGSVNIAMLLLAAVNFQGQADTDTIEGAYHSITSSLGANIGWLFALGLLASGLASTSVGAYAGSEVMASLLKVKVPLLLRRLLTLIPGLILLATPISPTWLLVVSQIFLSFGIPFALIPLVKLSSEKKILGDFVNSTLLNYVAWVIVILISLLNIVLIYLVFTGQGT